MARAIRRERRGGGGKNGDLPVNVGGERRRGATAITKQLPAVRSSTSLVNSRNALMVLLLVNKSAGH